MSWNCCQRPQAKAVWQSLIYMLTIPTPATHHPTPHHVSSSKTICRFRIQDSLFVELGIGIPMTLTGFRIHWAEFQIPKPRIPDSTIKNFPDSGLPITGRLSVEWIEAIEIFNEPRFVHKMLMIAVYIFPQLLIRNILIVSLFGCKIFGTFAVSESLFIRTWFLWLVEIWKPTLAGFRLSW